jgi:hypothetical protein
VAACAAAAQRVATGAGTEQNSGHPHDPGSPPLAAPRSPRDGWDHAQLWLPHGLALTGLQPRFIVAELTLAEVNPAMSEFIPLARKSRADAERAVDELWRPAAFAA